MFAGRNNSESEEIFRNMFEENKKKPKEYMYNQQYEIREKQFVSAMLHEMFSYD